jgi:trk system potassium uptake protein TrkA
MKKQARSAIIVGGSTTAQYLAMLLAKNRISVKIIEKDKERAQFLGENLPEKVAVVCGDGTDPELMREEGVASVDAIVAITGKDEENILIAYDAKLGGVGKVIVKVNRDGLFDVAEKLGIESIFSPRKLVADVVVRYARALESSIGSTMETLYSVMDGEVEALEFDVMPDFSHVGVALKEMKLKKNVLIAAILRGNDAIIPSGDDVIQSGDKIIVVSSQHRLCELSDIIR